MEKGEREVESKGPRVGEGQESERIGWRIDRSPLESSSLTAFRTFGCGNQHHCKLTRPLEWRTQAASSTFAIPPHQNMHQSSVDLTSGKTFQRFDILFCLN